MLFPTILCPYVHPSPVQRLDHKLRILMRKGHKNMNRRLFLATRYLLAGMYGVQEYGKFLFYSELFMSFYMYSAS